MNLPYTICFITDESSESVLMLRRSKPPRQGLWNRLGGKIDQGDLLQESVLREVYEQAGICPIRLTFSGILTWEGLLDWLPLNAIWCRSAPVVENLSHFLPPMLEARSPLWYHCVYEGSALKEVRPQPVSEELIEYAERHG